MKAPLLIVLSAFLWPLLAAAEDGDAVDTYVVNGVAFRVPREYQWLGKTPPDQNPVEGQRIYLLLHTEDMSAGSSKEEQAKNITVVIEKGGSGHYPLKDGTHYPSHLVNYWVRAKMSKSHNDGKPDRYVELSAEPIYLNHAFGLDYYKLPRKDAVGLAFYDFFL